MSKPSLRELFENWAAQKHISQADYALRKALVEAVEAQECPQGCDATIRKLRVERNDLREGRDGWEQGCAEAEQELAEAKERLEVRRSMCESWEGRCLKAERELAEAKAEIERLRPLADLGELVRGMRPHTALLKTETTYWGQIAQTRMEWSTADQPWFETDPAEALAAIQAIQEEGDDSR